MNKPGCAHPISIHEEELGEKRAYALKMELEIEAGKEKRRKILKIKM
jgi:hypothetical protein